MTIWSFYDSLAIGKRLRILLLAVAAYCAVVWLIIVRWGIRAPDWGSGASAIETIILGLLMSFRNRIAYDRWWEARGHWGRLVNDSRNLAAKFAAFVPADVLRCSHAGELIAGFADALKRHLRNEPTQLENLPGLNCEQAGPLHAPFYLAGRLYAEVAQWRRLGHIDDGVLWVFDQHLRGLLDVCGACEKIRSTPLSRSYTTLLRIGLLLNIIAEPWLTIPDIGFWDVPIFTLACFFLLGVELIDSVVEEPFGRERDDLDLDRYCQSIRESVLAALPPAADTTGPARPIIGADDVPTPTSS